MSIHIENIRRRLLEAQEEVIKTKANSDAAPFIMTLRHTADIAKGEAYRMLIDLTPQEVIELIRR